MTRSALARTAARVALPLLLITAHAAALEARTTTRRPRPRALPREGPAPRFDLPLAHAPLDTPLVVTGGFGEYRIGHFHAGFDFSTGGSTGKPVFAPLAGHVERIRASGVGYGRSLYLRTDDGRTLQFGHLDAFAEPMASWVRAIQDSSGQYEQDLWPEASRFPAKLGQRIAWTGQSGAGGPHMHFEIRRGDMAYQPMRAGLAARDDSPPELVSLTLETLDDSSTVEHGTTPYTIRLGAFPETVTVAGRVRAIVGARDGVWKGVDRMQPWLTRMDWDGGWIEARFDSVSWATDMPEGDVVYDAGRVTGEKGLVLWAPRDWRPRVIHASAPLPEEAGVLRVRPGDPPRTLRLSTRDVAGNRAAATVVLVPPGVRAARPAAAGRRQPRPPALTPGAGEEHRVVPGATTRIESPLGTWTLEVPTARASDGQLPGAWAMLRDATLRWKVVETVPAFPEGRRATAALDVGPHGLPLLKAARVELHADTARATGVYRWDGEEWSWVGNARDAARGTVGGDTRALGPFAAMTDTLAPRIGAPITAGSKGGPYPRWAIEAPLEERGSGVDARASWIEFDGARRPSEWDPEAHVLRWRPAARPARGTHAIVVVATDRAGNTRRRDATLVLD